MSFRIRQILLSSIALVILVGCSTTDSSRELSRTSLKTLQDFARDSCDAISQNDWNRAAEDISSLLAHPDKEKIRNTEEIVSLLADLEKLKNGTSKYTATAHFFCEDLQKFKNIQSIPSVNEKNRILKEEEKKIKKQERTTQDTEIQEQEISDSRGELKARKLNECIVNIAGAAGFSQEDLINAEQYCRKMLGY